MAKPRVFISSTFYDLKQVREDLERFITEMGYEAIRNETGSIPYGKEEPLESYAYKELGLCDIVVAIIGGRFGTASRIEDGSSITQTELSRALEKGIQVFIFVERGVLSEYSTYLDNKETPNVKYHFVDDRRIYEFIESIHRLPKNNPLAPFDTSADIIEFLRIQWAGLFQRFLEQQKRLSEVKILQEMKSVANTLQQVVKFLTDERKNKDQAVQNILLMNHPAFTRLKEIVGVPYRIFFSTYAELNLWLKECAWEPLSKDKWDPDSVAEWLNKRTSKYLQLTEKIFDEQQNLKVYTQDDWNNDWLVVNDYEDYLSDSTVS